MKKPNPQTEIRNLKRELREVDAIRKRLHENTEAYRKKMTEMQAMIVIQGDEINAWKERFDLLLKGQTK